MKTLLFTLILSLWMIGLSIAGPERPVTSTTFQFIAPSGPPMDPTALQGQWFQDLTHGLTYPKSWEFHDDDDPLSIRGIVQTVAYDPASNIVAFTVLATVVNNLPSSYQQGASSNSHAEVQSPPYASYSGTMQEARIAAEFAVGQHGGIPSGQAPYYGDPVSGGLYYIQSLNEDALAWYCWAASGDPLRPPGAFQVPTWNLGTLPVGSSNSVLMSFQISTPVGQQTFMPKTDYRYSVIQYSYLNQADIFYARHSSLKISHWLDTLLVDYGGYRGAPSGEPEPWPDYIYASDVSVFFDQPMDLGDAPDGPYPTLLVNDGARHFIVPWVFLGSGLDAESDGQPDPMAMGDDLNTNDDEEGVTWSGSLIRGSNTTFQIVASTNGVLNAWIDFDQNGGWLDTGEQIAKDFPLGAVTNTLIVSVPSQALWGQTFGRFRFSTSLGLLPSGVAYDGEVEDYAFTIYQPKPTTVLVITNISCNASNTLVTIKWNGETPLVYETHYATALATNMMWTAWGGLVGSAPYEQSRTISGQTSQFYRVFAPYTAP